MGKILIVDDDEVIADLFATLLRSKGYEVLTAYCSDKALALCKRDAPALLISDVNMPGLCGIELVRTVCGQFPETKCMLMSGGTDFDDARMRDKLKSLDVTATFNKPFIVADFLATVESALRG